MDLGNGISFNFEESDVLESKVAKDEISIKSSLKIEKNTPFKYENGFDDENRKFRYPNDTAWNLDTGQFFSKKIEITP